MKTQKLVSIIEPTDIVIIGSGSFDDDKVISFIKITDDESCFDIKVGDKSYFLSSDGFISIIPFGVYYSKLLELEEEDNVDYFDISDAAILPNFSGDISICIKLEDGSYAENIDTSDYIFHNYEIDDWFIDLPKGTEVFKIEEHDSTKFKSYIRDRKITEILDRN